MSPPQATHELDARAAVFMSYIQRSTLATYRRVSGIMAVAGSVIALVGLFFPWYRGDGLEWRLGGLSSAYNQAFIEYGVLLLLMHLLMVALAGVTLWRLSSVSLIAEAIVAVLIMLFTVWITGAFLPSVGIVAAGALLPPPLTLENFGAGLLLIFAGHALLLAGVMFQLAAHMAYISVEALARGLAAQQTP